jgi:hypothetical protein
MRRNLTPVLVVLAILAATAVAADKHWFRPFQTLKPPVAVPPSAPEALEGLSSDTGQSFTSALSQAVLPSHEVPATHLVRHASASVRVGSASGVQTPHEARSPSDEPTARSHGHGLPSSGMLCALDGGVLNCGACRSDSDCAVGTGCVANRETRRFECLASECEEDPHCFPGTVCRPVTTGASGPVIRRCVPSGTRQEGEPCDGLFISPEGACREGLSCHRGVCSRPCRLDDAAGCPEGHACEEGLNGPACFPDCRARGCAAGQHCKQLNEADFQCLSHTTGTCPETPCGDGERCNMRLSQDTGVFWCAALCNPLREDSCPSGQVCGMGGPTVSTCYRRCDPAVLDSCGDGWQCTTVSEDMTQWGCRPSAP